MIPWRKLEQRIKPGTILADREREPHPSATMLRIHCLQNFFNLSDPGAEEAWDDGGHAPLPAWNGRRCDA